MYYDNFAFVENNFQQALTNHLAENAGMYNSREDAEYQIANLPNDELFEFVSTWLEV